MATSSCVAVGLKTQRSVHSPFSVVRPHFDHPSLILICQHLLVLQDVVVYVAEARRSFLDSFAFLKFVEAVMPRRANSLPNPLPVRSDWMGCFTKDSKLCNELFQAGVPVWFVRFDFTVTDSTIVKKPVTFTFP